MLLGNILNIPYSITTIGEYFSNTTYYPGTHILTVGEEMRTQCQNVIAFNPKMLCIEYYPSTTNGDKRTLEEKNDDGGTQLQTR